jgi:hypothetical protein
MNWRRNFGLTVTIDRVRTLLSDVRGQKSVRGLHEIEIALFPSQDKDDFESWSTYTERVNATSLPIVY